MEESQEQKENSQTKMGGGASNFKPWLFKKGQSGNPGGRPKGPSMKTWAQNKLATMTEEERENFLDGLPKDILWRMAEGQPHQSTETEVKGVLKIEFASEFKKDDNQTPNETAS